MKLRNLLLIFVLFTLATGVVYADDGAMFRRNVSKTPEQETERANLNHMAFYVPAQTSDGELTLIEYVDASGTVTDTREYAKPLVAVYIDGLPTEETTDGLSVMSGAGWGAHDAHAALSLDDGASWKRTNLSMSADLSSFTLANGHAYPGDAHNMTFAIAGDKVLVGWISKYCDGGSAAYTLTDENDTDGDGNTTEKLYPDIWGVSGAQGSVDYTLQGFPEVGEIPYSCVWAARGTLLPVSLDDETPDTKEGYDIIWTKAERLTSGVRDANRLEMAGDSAAGFMMTWQEDPEGLRPGTGLGPGEGWSGAVVNGKTDLWYSYISMDNFVQVQTSDEDTTPISIYNYTGESLPKVAAPMALPVRLTDNDMCKATGSKPYCYIDFDNVDTEGNLILPDPLPTTFTDESDYCATQVPWTTPSGTTLNLCVAEDGRVMQGRVGASRPRVNVQPYDGDGDGVYDNAWVILGAEESKSLGGGSPDDPGSGKPVEEEPEDMGKNMWYYTFDMLNPDVVQQGLMLNQPAKCNPYDVTVKGCALGEFMLLEDQLYEGNEFYETEISRRFSHFSQPIHQIGDSGVGAALIVKQGILYQGGPADVFLRLLKVPDDVWIPCPDNSPHDKCLPPGYNPYAYENMDCDEWAYRTDLGQEANPRYLEGLCLSDMINVSGTTIDECDAGTPEYCAENFPWDGGVTPFPKVTRWSQTVENLSDQSWANPYDVSKGHRGFIDGDFIMMMYAWSPNWQANSVGNDHYNLYARRSFDGGTTWTTTPGGDGTTTCENFKGTDGEITPVCTTYAAGEFEQARNLSQLIGNKETILDPRYTPTGGLKMLPITDLKGVGFSGYPDDVRDPTKFFIVYETGDNTTVAEGEAVPLDLFYSRATNWGDDYDLVEYYNSSTGETTLEFDWLEHDREDLSGEAANTANNAGTFYYAIWNQWQEDEEENVSDSDAIFRRIMYSTLDLPPTASILFTSSTGGSYENPVNLTFIGTAKDNDRMGDGTIDNFKWTSDKGWKPVEADALAAAGEVSGLVSVAADEPLEPVVLSTEKSFAVSSADLALGLHTISFTAQDEEGNWAPEKVVTVLITETDAQLAPGAGPIYLPLIIK